MTEEELNRYLRRLYRTMLGIAAAGTAAYLRFQGPRPAAAFDLGVLGSFGNLLLFNWLGRAMSPGGGGRKPWQAATFISRYLLLFALGYVIVKGLGVSPLPVILGLLESTAALLIYPGT